MKSACAGADLMSSPGIDDRTATEGFAIAGSAER